ncbi:peptidylprolyl isomerase [Halpernia frigidisoli]|uniref:Periplasmic chaperone PpiD n=1 Tax=Halpernia frigidisoli TaxID=1125876 RepID=A0A1I3I216_9FLAO|nr:peptidylprolyl isomerase [Halpernia frigidisoli]SFI41890.1 peptidyl-prolyl cis-trans isomerase D [Halpernia frigidisoli]
MAVLGEIRKRPWLLMGAIAVALLAFLVNPASIEKVFGRNPDVLGKVNGDAITREEFNNQLYVLQSQAQQQGQTDKGLEEQAWQMMVQSKLIAQQFEKMGLKLTDDMFWSQLQFDPLFAKNKENFDEKGNFKSADIKKQIEDLETSGNVEGLAGWNKMKGAIQYRMMARQLFANISNGITVSKKEAGQMVKMRDENAVIDYVKVDYAAYAKKNPIKVTTEDLKAYIDKHKIMFKADASRNIGLVYFPSAPSSEDDATTLKEITKLYTGGTESNGAENFQNTKSDSAFIALNSDLPYNAQYFSQEQLPLGIKAQAATASIGQSFGPYKEQSLYVVSKILDKKPSDSTLSRHILVSYTGNQAAGGATRTKEEAKKLADSIGNILKSQPAKFTEFLKYSSDPGSAAQGGSVGWTTPATPFVKPYLDFLANNSKGATGVVESQFGYHIINIEDKKSGAMSYKLANLVKEIKPSDKTDNKVYSDATKFIQQVQGKSFNDFANIAKKNNFNFSNPKTVKRFDGKLQGIGSDKDEDVIAWAFDKKTKKGDSDIFSIEGTGGKIVAFVNGVQEAGTADPESVRDQIEPIVMNELLGKKIAEKIANAKPSSLDQVAKMFGVAKANAQVNVLNPTVGGAMEPKVAGAAFGVGNNKISNAVEGMTGVYVVQRKSITTNKQPGDEKQILQAITQQNSQQFGQAFLKSLQDNSDIKDYRIEVFGKVQEQQ